MTRQSEQPNRNLATTSRSGRFFTTGHLMMALVVGVVIGLFWTRLYRAAENSGGMAGVIMIGVFLLTAMVMTLWWIRHNVTLSKRFGERRTRVYEVEGDWSHDKLGRPVSVTDWGSLQTASRVDIEVDDHAGRKIYREV